MAGATEGDEVAWFEFQFREEVKWFDVVQVEAI